MHSIKMHLESETRSIPEQKEVMETNWPAVLILEELTAKLDSLSPSKANALMDRWLSSLHLDSKQRELDETSNMQCLLTELSLR